MFFFGPWLLFIDRFFVSLYPWAAAKHAARAEDRFFGPFVLGSSFVARTIARKTGLSPLASLLIYRTDMIRLDWDNNEFFFVASFTSFGFIPSLFESFNSTAPMPVLP